MILVLLLAARAALVGRLGPGRDELGYWYWAWHGLNAGYSLVTVGAVRLFTALAGDGVVALRAPGFLAAAAAVWVLIRLARNLGASPRQARWIGIALAAAPWQTYVGSVVHPDAFLTLFLLWFAERVTAAGPNAIPTRGQILGAAVAAAGVALSKLTGALLLPVAIAFLWRQRRAAPRTAAVSAGFPLGAAALLWFHRDPQVLAGVREFGRFAADADGWSRGAMALLESVALGGPALWVLGIAGAIALARPAGRWPLRRDARALLLATGGGLVLTHAVFAALGQVKGNWWLPPLAVWAPVGWIALTRHEAWSRRLALVAVGASLLIAFQCTWPGAEARWERIRGTGPLAGLDRSYSLHAGDREVAVSPTRSWTGRFAEFTAAAPTLDRPTSDGAPPRVVSNDYGLAFAIARHWGRDAEVHLPWDPIYARTCGRPPEPGEDLIFVSRNWSAPPPEFARRFEALEERTEAAAVNDPRLVVLYCRSGRSLPGAEWTH